MKPPKKSFRFGKPFYSLTATKGGKILILAVLAVAAVGFFSFGERSNEIFRTAEVTRGDLLVAISATGTVEPEEVIDVGAQVAGLILELGQDAAGKMIDYGSEVDEGTVLAKIDQSLYLTDVAQADAQLNRAKADVDQAKAKLAQTERDWKRAQKIGPSDALSQSAYDTYEANFEIAKANVSVANAEVVQADAALQKANRNLGYTVIKSPVKGVIIDRRVNIGQTVVSSLNAPSLFLIAKDLRKMEVWVSVNEADIGNIHPNQKVTFSVDAFPGEEFSGEVRKIRLNASMAQNVVTYIVEVSADNSSGRLLPYLTANVKFEVTDRQNVLLVPNAALRWTPKSTQRAEPKPRKSDVASPETKEQPAILWTPADDRAQGIYVTTGGTDGVMTEVSGEGLAEGMKIIIGEKDAKNAQQSVSGTTNPFAPPVMRGGGRRGGRM